MLGMFLVLIVALGGEAYVAKEACKTIHKENIESKACKGHK